MRTAKDAFPIEAERGRSDGHPARWPRRNFLLGGLRHNGWCHSAIMAAAGRRI